MDRSELFICIVTKALTELMIVGCLWYVTAEKFCFFALNRTHSINSGDDVFHGAAEAEKDSGKGGAEERAARQTCTLSPTRVCT